MAVSIYDKIHLKVSESFSIGFGRSFVYACATGYVGGPCGLAFPFGPSFKVGMASVAAQLPAFIGVYDVVDSLNGD